MSTAQFCTVGGQHGNIHPIIRGAAIRRGGRQWRFVWSPIGRFKGSYSDQWERSCVRCTSRRTPLPMLLALPSTLHRPVLCLMNPHLSCLPTTIVFCTPLFILNSSLILIILTSNMHHGTDASTQSAPNAGFDLDSPAIIDLIDPTLSVSQEFVVSPQFADLTMFSLLQPHEQLLDSGYLFLPQVPYQFSQPTTPISIPIPLNQSYDFDPTGMSDSYSPVMDYGSHYPDQRYPSRNVPRSNTSFPATSFAPAYLSGSSGTPSTFNSPIRHLPHISPFTSSPSPPPPQVNPSLVTSSFRQLTLSLGSPNKSNDHQQCPSYRLGPCSCVPGYPWHSCPTEDI